MCNFWAQNIPFSECKILGGWSGVSCHIDMYVMYVALTYTHTFIYSSVYHQIELNCQLGKEIDNGKHVSFRRCSITDSTLQTRNRLLIQRFPDSRQPYPSKPPTEGQVHSHLFDTLHPSHQSLSRDLLNGQSGEMFDITKTEPFSHPTKSCPSRTKLSIGTRSLK